MKIGFQGDVGSNAEEATFCFISDCGFENATAIPLINSKNVVSSLIKSEIDYGIMAVYNSTVGDVIETKNALNKHIKQIKTVDIPIHHCLFSKSKDAKIDFVASHIQALKQTTQTRKRILPLAQEIECADTALAAKMLFKGEYQNNYAVICKKSTGEFYGLYLLAENIEDNKNNRTTFGLFSLAD